MIYDGCFENTMDVYKLVVVIRLGWVSETSSVVSRTIMDVYKLVVVIDLRWMFWEYYGCL